MPSGRHVHPSKPCRLFEMSWAEQLEEDINLKLRKLAEVTKALSTMWDQRFWQLENDMREQYGTMLDVTRQVGVLQEASRHSTPDLPWSPAGRASPNLQWTGSQEGAAEVAELRSELQARWEDIAAFQEMVTKSLGIPTGVVDGSRVEALQQTQFLTSNYADEVESLRLKLGCLARETVNWSEVQSLVSRLDSAEKKLETVSMENSKLASKAETWTGLAEHVANVSKEVGIIRERMERDFLDIDALRKVEEDVEDVRQRVKLDLEMLENKSSHVEAQVRGLQVRYENQEQEVSEMRDIAESEARRVCTVTEHVKEMDQRTDTLQHTLSKTNERVESAELEIEALRTGTVALATQGRKLRELETHKVNRDELDSLQECVEQKVADLGEVLHDISSRVPELRYLTESSEQRTSDLEAHVRTVEEHILRVTADSVGVKHDDLAKKCNLEIRSLQSCFEKAAADIEELKSLSISSAADVRSLFESDALKVDRDSFDQLMELVIRYGRCLDALRV